MDIYFSQNFDFNSLKRKVPRLIADRINKDITIVKREIEKGIRDSKSPITGAPFAPITETTRFVRSLRRQNRKSKTKPLLATGRMSKLIRKNAQSRRLKGSLTMGANYGVYHQSPQTIKSNFFVKGRERWVQTHSGNRRRVKGKGTFFTTKGAKVPARPWFGEPRNYDQSIGFRRLLNKMKVALKGGKKIRRKHIGRLTLG